MTRLAAVGTVVALALGSMLASPAQAAVTIAGPGDATFTNYLAPGDLGRDAGEPSIGVNHNTNRTMFQNGLETLQVTFDDGTFPATASYKDVSFDTTSITTFDPILFTDPLTGRTIVSQLLPPDDLAAYTDDDGDTYTPSTAISGGANFDHQTYGGGPAKTALPSTPAYPGDRIVYYCSQLIAQASCGVSRDGANTIAYSRPTYTIDDRLAPDLTVPGCAGLHGHLRVAPNGTAFLPNFGCTATVNGPRRPAAVVSENDGLDWTIRQIPDATGPNFDSDPSAAADANNRAYFAYENATSNLLVTTTDDAGRTFTPSVDLGAPFGIQNAAFPAVIAGSAGRAAVAFLGTPAEAPLNEAGNPENQLFSFDPDGNDPTGGWHAYISLTYDGGANWTTQDITPTDPVQRGCIWWGEAQDTGDAAECQRNPKRNLLDFNDISVDKLGRVVFGYADGCVGTCVTQGHLEQTNARPAGVKTAELLSQEDIGVIARQSCGRGLFAAFDADPNGPLAKCAAAGGGGTQDPDPVIPEIPFVPALLLAGAAAGGGLIWVRRRKDAPAL